MILAVASGKGGTGKTTVAASLASALIDSGQPVSFLDCDVEAPNGHLFLGPVFDQRRDVNILIPQVDKTLCTGCGRCAEVCEFHAIVVLGGKPLVFSELCHGCGSCTLECPEKAISEIPQTLGILESGSTSTQIKFARGLLNVGEPMAVPVISQLKKWQVPSPEEIMILDSPPGTSCPVVESIRGADFVILVTEPTPFGLHDLKLAVQLTEKLGIPAGVIVNRDGVGDTKVDDYCQEADLSILMRIPLERKIGAGIAEGQPLTEIYPEYGDRFCQMYTQIQGRLKEKDESKNSNQKIESWRTYILSSIMGALTFAQLICFFFFYNDDGYQVFRILGWMLWGLSLVFGILPIYIFRKKAGVAKGKSFVHTTVLVDSGLYGIVRHPQYLAGILLNLTLILISQHWLSALLGIPAMVLMVMDIQKADQHEVEKFGEAYQRYMDRVPSINFLLGIIRQVQRRSENI